MVKQSSVTLHTEQYLVKVMTCTSLTMPTLTKTRIVTLATHTKHQLGISITLPKPSRLLVAHTSHQQKLKYFTEQLQHSTKNTNPKIDTTRCEKITNAYNTWSKYAHIFSECV